MSELEQSQSSAEFKEKQALQSDKPTKSLAECISALSKFGGYQFVEGLVDGAQNLNPERKARRNIFLTDPEKKSEKEALSKKIDIWLQLLSENNGMDEMADFASKKAEESSSLLKGNLKKISEDCKELETSYRSVALFFQNIAFLRIQSFYS